MKIVASFDKVAQINYKLQSLSLNLEKMNKLTLFHNNNKKEVIKLNGRLTHLSDFSN